MSEKELDEILDEIKRNSRISAQQSNDQGADAPITKAELDDVVAEFSSARDTVSDKQDDIFSFNEVSADAPATVDAPADPEPVAVDLDAFDSAEPIRHSTPRDSKSSKKSNKGIIIAIIAVVVAIAVGVGVYFAFFRSNDDGTIGTVKRTTVAKSDAVVDTCRNPLTGETGFDESALTQRPVAVVVENEYSTSSVRPQWGLDEADIVLEGESEFSTRLLLFWADYNKVPSQVGPARSARPPFIYFSQLFDAVFIHAGLSHSRGNYVGASEVFSNNNIDHINLLNFSEDNVYFGRDKTRTSTIEHTGYLNGTNVAKMLEAKNINTTLNESKFSRLVFNTEPQVLSDNLANVVTYKWSDRCPKKATFTFDSDEAKYYTTDFDSQYGVSKARWENLIFLNDQTEYVVKENYKGSGSSETYCNYKLAGGDGIVVSRGTYIDIKWGVTDGKLWIHDAAGADVALNPGKSYIGYGSANHSGAYTIELE